MEFNNKNQSYIDEGMSHIFMIILFIIIPPIVFVRWGIFDYLKNIGIIITVMWLGLIIAIWIGTKERILGAIRTKYYNENERKILENGDKLKGKIIEVKSLGWYGQSRRYNFRKGWEGYYLIVEVDGEKIKSKIFSDNKYQIGQEIDVACYNNHKYILIYR